MCPSVSRIFVGRHLPLIGSIMFSAYVASRNFLDLQKLQLGEGHPCVPGSAVTEVTHLCAIFRQSEPDREDVTKLLEYVQGDKSNAFNKEQKDSLVVAASICLSTMVAPDGSLASHTDTHGGQKLQTHLYTYVY